MPTLIIIAIIAWIIYMVNKKTNSDSLSTVEIVTHARNAGFDGSDLIVAVAIALAESGGNPRAYNPEIAAGTPQGMGSYGLWQIYRKVHPEFTTWNLYDPATNARAAFAVYKAAHNTFKPWSTFIYDKYTAHLDDVESAIIG